MSTSGDSSQSSGPHTPPPKPSKSSARYKAKKGRKEVRKRKGKGLSRSSALPCSSESMSSDSDHETAKKHDKYCKYTPGNTHQSSSLQLTMADHHKVVKFLRDLGSDELIKVGVALGLHRPSLKRMKDGLLGDMIDAWLREDDNVTVTGGSPSWASLATALEDTGHKGIANKIRKGYSCTNQASLVKVAHTGPIQATQTATPLSPEMSRYRNYLRSYYKTNPVARDDKLSIAPCSEFINLTLVKKDESTFLCGDRDEISGAHKVPLELDAILTPDDRFVLVEGTPGIGKSTLSWELCRKWDTLESLQCYNIVLLLRLREGRVQNAGSLNELFYHEDKALCENVVCEVLRCEGEGVLLIMDGFDELPTSVVKKSLITRIIGSMCIPRATLLVTSRPSVLDHTEYFPQEYRHVEIVGFTDESMEKFAEIAFKSEPNVLSNFKKFIFSNPIIKSLMYTPVNCAILVQSFKDIVKSSKPVAKTTTQLYTMLTRVLIRRHLIAVGRWNKCSKVPNDLKDLPEDVFGDLERVSNLAYTGLLKEDVQLVFSDSDVGEDFNALGLLSEVKEMYVCEGARTSYSFLHLSIQEFLAAWHVSRHQELVKEALAKALHSHLHVFDRILAGLIGIDDFFIEYLMASKRYTFCGVLLHVCYCVYEVQNNMSRNIFDKFESLYSSIFLFTPFDMYVFGYCLANFSHQWLHVTICSSFDMLISSLSDHASGHEILGKIETLELKVKESSLSSAKLKDLPHGVLCSTRRLIFESSALLDGIPVLPCLQKILISSNILSSTPVQHDDYGIVLGKCPNLKSLKVLGRLSETGVCGLTKAIASSSTIEEIELSIHPLHCNGYQYRMDSLAQAALSCASLTSLETNFPFVISNNTQPTNLQMISVLIQDLSVTKLLVVFDYLFSITNACKVSPLKSISWSTLDHMFYLFVSPLPLSLLPCDCVGGYCDCMSLLNTCLHLHWPSLKELKLPFSVPCTQFHLSSLSRALRRDPDTSQLKLRRSKSLSDLECLKTLEEHAGEYHTSTNPTFQDMFYGNQRVTPAESCPDLVGIQSLHPLIEKQLFEFKSQEDANMYDPAACPIS